LGTREKKRHENKPTKPLNFSGERWERAVRKLTYKCHIARSRVNAARAQKPGADARMQQDD
jgi:hypothetical protein